MLPAELCCLRLQLHSMFFDQFDVSTNLAIWAVCAGDMISVHPCILELDDTMDISVDGVTLSVARTKAMTSSTAKAVHVGPLPTSSLIQGHWRRSALFAEPFPVDPVMGVIPVDEVVFRARDATGAPQGCVRPEADWSPEKLDSVVLSCISFDMQDTNGPSNNEPLESAMNITGNGITIIGFTFFGCVRTALGIFGQKVYIAVRSRCQRKRGACHLHKLVDYIERFVTTGNGQNMLRCFCGKEYKNH
jgi:hypothetical protein